jgi:alkylation response protein AidB-like acyl-CoA dehydrogenase
MLHRTLFEPEHDMFREAFRKFVETEISPHHAAWEADQHISREAWLKAGEQGFLCQTMPEKYGGAGVDRRFSLIIIEELGGANTSGPGFPLHSDIVAPYIRNYGTPDQKQTWLPKMATGEVIGAIAMTEPGTGSDLQGIKTRAVVDGDELVLDGEKIFITNGFMADLVIVAAQVVDPATGGEPKLSLMLVEATRDGFTKEKPLKKLGQKAQDTCILNFSGVRVPKSNILGGENAIGGGLMMLFGELAWERLMIGIGAVASAKFCYEQALSYTKERQAFGRALAEFQDVRFKLADMKVKISAGQAMIDQCMTNLALDKLRPEDAAGAKLWCSEMAFEVADTALQMHGGYGYMQEYPITRAFADIRVLRIYGGANEIMKELISRTL